MTTLLRRTYSFARWLILLEVGIWRSLLLWVTRRVPGQRRGMKSFSYAQQVTPILGGFIFVSAVEVPVVDLLLPALGVTFVAFSDNILTARAFAADDDGVNPRRELFALGAANLGAGVMQAFPVSSSGSRTAIAVAVGARSQLAGLVTVAGTILAVVFARPLL